MILVCDNCHGQYNGAHFGKCPTCEIPVLTPKERKYNHELRNQLHTLCEKIWPWNDWMARKVMYRTLYQITGKKHISRMNYPQLINALAEIKLRLKSQKSFEDYFK
jgi:hypothetical protein